MFKYGKEWKELSLSSKYVAVDANRHVYICGKCGHWDVEPDLSLYAPNDAKAIKEKQDEIKKMREEPFCVWGFELKEDYHILQRKNHVGLKYPT